MYEVNQWLEYRYRRGSLNAGRRVEQTGANIASIFINREITEPNNFVNPLIFMPHEDDVVETFEDSMK